MEIKKYGNLPEFMSLSEFHCRVFAYYSCSTVFVKLINAEHYV